MGPDVRGPGQGIDMGRTEVFRQIVLEATRPLDHFEHPPTPTAGSKVDDPGDLFVWFEDTSERQLEGGRGIAGLPESLLPVGRDIRVIDRQYSPGHQHLLAAVRVRCHSRSGERIAAIYTAALSVGTVAWIGAGAQYANAWDDLYGSHPAEA
jgi:hypothetical protein